MTTADFPVSTARRTAGTFERSAEVGLPTLARQVVNLLRERRDAARERARLRWELNQYSDRALADMGMARSDIEDVVHGRFAV